MIPGVAQITAFLQSMNGPFAVGIALVALTIGVLMELMEWHSKIGHYFARGVIWGIVAVAIPGAGQALLGGG